MLKPKIIQLPDYSEYIGKEFIITENSDMINASFGIPILKGVRFIIKKIKNTKATIKVSNSKQELEELGMLDYDFNRVIKDIEKNIKILERVCRMWNDGPEMFIIDEDDFWYKNRDADNRGHCINTGYNGIPFNHPDKYGQAKPYYNDKGKYINDDSIMTLIYKRIDDKRNIYSYQRGSNEFYSKECYGFMLKSEEIKLEDWKKRTEYNKKCVFVGILEKKEISIKNLNNLNFELVV